MTFRAFGDFGGAKLAKGVKESGKTAAVAGRMREDERRKKERALIMFW